MAGKGIIRTLSLKITANAAKFKKELAAARTPLERFKIGLKGIGGMIKSAFAVSAIVAAVTAVGQFAVSIAKATNKVKKLTGLTGKELYKVTGQIKAISKTYKKEFDEVLISANAFAKQMNISQAEALEHIRNGFAQGADASGEFLNMLKEYPVFFKEAGLSATQAINAMSHSVKSGVFSDKGPDAIKEATLSIREMTKASSEALAGIGIDGDELKRKIDSGAMSMGEAIQLISKKMGELPKTSAKVGAVIADVFKGAGEDAGYEFITSLSVGLSETKRPIDAAAKAQDELVKSSARLETAWSNMFAGSAIAWTEFITGAKNALAKLIEINTLVASSNKLETFKDASSSIPSLISEIETLEEKLKNLTKGSDEYKQTIEAILAIAPKAVELDDNGLTVNLKNLQNYKAELTEGLTGLKADSLKEQEKGLAAINNQLRIVKAQLNARNSSGELVELIDNTKNRSGSLDRGGRADDKYASKLITKYKELLRLKEQFEKNKELLVNPPPPPPPTEVKKRAYNSVSSIEGKGLEESGLKKVAESLHKSAGSIEEAKKRANLALEELGSSISNQLTNFAALDPKQAFEKLSSMKEEIDNLQGTIDNGGLEGQFLTDAINKVDELRAMYELLHESRKAQMEEMAVLKEQENIELQKTQELGLQAADAFTDVAASSILAGKSITQSFKEAALGMIKQIGLVIAKALILAAIITAIPGLGTALEAMGTIKEGVSSGGFGNVFGALLGKSHAMGTSFTAGGLTLVGETGPELLDIPRGSTISSPLQTAQLFGQKTPVINNISVLIDDDAIHAANARRADNLNYM
ncbi:phage tail tape measure protein [Xanthovirga aplysinae]|uniref:phage tail tape measure protein n=1 Tax=Xanthovirga aplysinae TaxID=2529853 RepID=UPI0012BD18BD|nr:phage tail tape measure protein [Xanthovirga aplysinae]MTI32819.1 hypothetical protein [Xanthovirga aplysinae]